VAVFDLAAGWGEGGGGWAVGFGGAEGGVSVPCGLRRGWLLWRREKQGAERHAEP